METGEIIDKLTPSVKEAGPAKLTHTIIPPIECSRIYPSICMFDEGKFRWIASHESLKQGGREYYSKGIERVTKEYYIEEMKEKIENHVRGIPEWKEMSNEELTAQLEKTIKLLEGWWRKLIFFEGIKYSDIDVFLDPFIKEKNLDQKNIELFKDSMHIEGTNRETKKELQLIELIKKVKNGISGKELEPELYLNPKYMGFDRYELYGEIELEGMDAWEIENKIKNKNKIDPDKALEELEKEVEISEGEKEKIKMTRFASYILDERRYFANLLNMGIHVLVEEFSKRLNISKEELEKIGCYEFLELLIKIP